MIELSVLGDCSVEDLLREVVSTDIPTDSDGVPSESLDFLDNELNFLFIEAAEIKVSIEPRDR